MSWYAMTRVDQAVYLLVPRKRSPHDLCFANVMLSLLTADSLTHDARVGFVVRDRSSPMLVM